LHYDNLSVKNVKVTSPKIYIKKSYLGVTADREAIIISLDSSKNVVQNKDIVFEGVRNFDFYYIKNDTLNIVIYSMDLVSYNPMLGKMVRIDTTTHSNFMIYKIFEENKMLNDSIKIVRF
jgi:hypothetical protein